MSLPPSIAYKSFQSAIKLGQQHKACVLVHLHYSDHQQPNSHATNWRRHASFSFKTDNRQFMLNTKRYSNLTETCTITYTQNQVIFVQEELILPLKLLGKKRSLASQELN